MSTYSKFYFTLWTIETEVELFYLLETTNPKFGNIFCILTKWTFSNNSYLIATLMTRNRIFIWVEKFFLTKSSFLQHSFGRLKKYISLHFYRKPYKVQNCYQVLRLCRKEKNIQLHIIGNWSKIDNYESYGTPNCLLLQKKSIIKTTNFHFLYPFLNTEIQDFRVFLT